MSNSKHQPYYFNPKSLESRWDPPEGADFEKLKDHMAKNYSSSILNPRANGNGAGGDKIRCAHVLVKHRDSRRPSSWRQAKITRSKEEARSILQRFQERINSGETTLGDLAVSESDCTSARKRGDLYVRKLYLMAASLADPDAVVTSQRAKCRRSSRTRHSS